MSSCTMKMMSSCTLEHSMRLKISWATLVPCLMNTIHSQHRVLGDNFLPAHSIKKSSGVEYVDMLFFDDEYGNIRDISSIGWSTCLHDKPPVPVGLYACMIQV